jgi:hypothetical protein
VKERPTADYPVRVVRETNELDDAVSAPYEGIYTVVLNHIVSITFVPDVSAQAPPWDGSQLPVDFDVASTVEQARLEMVLAAHYAVTPNTSLAGEVERFPETWRPASAPPGPPMPDELRRGWVRYVTSEEFDGFATELPVFHEVVLGMLSGATVSRLTDFQVMRFIAEQVVAAHWLHPRDARMLGRGDGQVR